MNKEAEQSVLGACMLEMTAYDTVVETGLTASDFQIAAHRLIWEAICDLASYGTDIDMMTVSDRLIEKGTLEQAGDKAYIAHLTNTVLSTESVGDYAAIVVKYSRKRQLQVMADNVIMMLAEKSDIESVLEYTSDQVARISEGGSESTAFCARELLKKAVAELEGRFEGYVSDYKTGLNDLDNVLRPEGGRVTLVAGRPGMGKSALANKIIEASCSAKIPTLLFTMEMPGTEVLNRLICAIGRINSQFIQDPKRYATADDWSKLTAAASVLKDWPLEVDEKSSASLQHIRSKVKAFLRRQDAYRESGKGIILIDYLGLMKMGDKNRTHAIGEITKGLKALAVEMKVPVILLHQLNRGLESRPDKRPLMSDLRDSGEIEEDVDHIVMLYRDEVYNEDSPDKGIAELIIRKNRTGQNNVAVRVSSQLHHYRFDNLANGYYEQH